MRVPIQYAGLAGNIAKIVSELAARLAGMGYTRSHPVTTALVADLELTLKRGLT